MTETTVTDLATSPEDRPVPPRRRLRRAWRTLTSMRTALLLLFLLALAAVPGSLLPQRGLNPGKVDAFVAANPAWSRVLDRLHLFDVYGAWWFAAIYLALMVSLVGCLVPRLRIHWRALRSRPPAPPKHLDRLPFYASWHTAAETSPSLRRWRVQPYDTGLAAERGYLRETGNLVFHVALLLLLIGIGLGSAYGYRGDVLVVEGDTFVNTPAAYDQLSPGRLNRLNHLKPFEVTLDDFRAAYLPSGQPRSFDAKIRWRAGDSGPVKPYDLKVNDPLTVGGARVYLLDHGYALHFTGRLPNGTVIYDQWQPFLPVPNDQTLTSLGAIKIADVGHGLPDIGLRALFLPTLGVDRGAPYSAYPEPRFPAISYEAYAGDLGLGSGVPQSVYDVDVTKMVHTGDGLLLSGSTATGLAGGATLTFDGIKEFAVFHVTDDPGKRLVLVAAVAALLGLVLSLRVRRRRVWVRRTGTLVEVGGLARQDPDGFAPEFADLVRRLTAALPEE